MTREDLTALAEGWVTKKTPLLGEELGALAADYLRLLAQIDLLSARYHEMADAAEMLWVVLANVSGGDWTKQTPEWQDAVAHWRDRYFAAIADYEHVPPRQTEATS